MNTRSEKKRADFLKQGGILALASLIVRFIGMIYRIPMSNILGEEGNGLYGLAFEIYDVILIISSYSLPIALSKIISAQQAGKQYKNTGKTFRVAMTFAVCSGGIFGGFLFFGANLIETYIYPEYSGVQIPIRILAPTIFIVALLGVFRGFFQGKKTMVPTAVSQVIEQIINAIVSVAASYFFIKWNAESMYQAAWGAAGGTLGTCLGAASALLLVLFVYWLYRPIQEKLERRDRSQSTLSSRYLFKVLILTILPIVLSQTVYNISGLIDYKLFGWISGRDGVDSYTIKTIVGIYSSKYRTLSSVPIAISTAIASSMIPSAVAAYTERDTEQLKYNIASGMKFNMIIAFPCTVGFIILGQPIIQMLFTNTDYVLGGRMMMAGAAAILFYALSNVTGGALQSIDKMRLPVIHSAISLVLHIILVACLLHFTGIGIYALIIGNVTFPIVVFALNLLAIKRYIPSYRQETTKTFLAPLSASLWMAVAIVIVYWGLGLIIQSNIIRTLAALLAAVFVYFVVFLLLKGLTRDELFDFPMGRRLYLLARKLRIMN
ncbi:MAG: polysaccharide biosynthesis protein [Lachnospiraceae bacterium]|nr:polysaccharide biosynthesis protein [Lachnospiraceae bacterium]